MEKTGGNMELGWMRGSEGVSRFRVREIQKEETTGEE